MPARLQQMMLHLQKYEITIVHCAGKDISVADTLSQKYLCNNNNSSIGHSTDIGVTAQRCNREGHSDAGPYFGDSVGLARSRKWCPIPVYRDTKNTAMRWQPWMESSSWQTTL